MSEHQDFADLQMKRNCAALCLIAVAAVGCSSEPPREIPPDTETASKASFSDQQGHGFTALPPLEATYVDQAPDGQDQGFPYISGTQATSPDRSFRQQYEALAALPEAESRRLRFHLGSQTFDYLEDGEVFVTGPIASGKPSSPTPTGKFRVLSKDKDKESSRYTNEVGTPAWMPYSLQFHGNYFIHEGWLPGHPASHGCIRLSHYHARLLFERMKKGDPVTVTN